MSSIPKKLTPADLEQLFSDIFTGPEEGMPALVSRWFSPSYIQVTDGKTSNFDEFVAHLSKVRSMISTVEPKVLYLAQEDNRLADRHIMRGVKKDGSTLHAEMLCLMERGDDGRIVRTWETSRLLDGKETTESLASA